MLKRNIRKKKNKGFTLVELVIVVAILAILVGLLAPQYTKYVENSRKAADASNMDELVNAFKIYALSGGELKTTTYDITIKSGISANATSTEGGITGITGYGSTDSDGSLNTALNEECPNWGNLQTKSKKWGTNGKASAIVAHIVVQPDGGISVSYSPKKFAEYLGKPEYVKNKS